MKTTIKDLTIDEFRDLITSAFREALEDLVEDISALSSDSYLESIKAARRDFDSGNLTKLKEAFDA